MLNDEIELKKGLNEDVVKEISKIEGPVYLRLSRLATPIIYDKNYKFEIGKAVQIGDGTDASIIATGITVNEAIKAKEEFSKNNYYENIMKVYKGVIDNG